MCLYIAYQTMKETYEITGIEPGYFEDYNLVKITNHAGLTSLVIVPKSNTSESYNVGDKLVLTLEPTATRSTNYFGVCDDLRTV